MNDDEQREQPREAVHAQVEVEAELRQPREPRSHDGAIDYFPILHADQHHARHRHGAREPGRRIARVGRQEGRADAAEERQENDQREQHRGVRLHHTCAKQACLSVGLEPPVCRRRHCSEVG